MLALVWTQGEPHTVSGSRAASSGFMAPGDARSSGDGMSASGSLGPSASLPAPVPEHGTLPQPSGGDARAGWQLLTGHENGQLLVWNAARDRLQPACKLGEAGGGGGGGAVRAVASLDAWGLIVVAHAGGELALFPRAARASDWGGLAGGAAAVPVGSSSGSPSAPAPATAVGVPCVRPRRAVLRAHRSAIVAAAACPFGVATASGMGSLRLWRAADLARAAERAGLPIQGAARRTTAASSASLDG